jgi:hypothetical protein
MGGKIIGLNPCDEVMFCLTIYKIWDHRLWW